MQNKTKGAGAQAFTPACVLYRLGSMPDLFLKAYRQHSAQSVGGGESESYCLDRQCTHWGGHLSFCAPLLLGPE